MNWEENNKKLIEKYSTESLLHVEYPNKIHWKIIEDDTLYKQKLFDHFSKTNGQSVIYIHVPFCEKLCYYCKCVKEITHDYSKIENYLKSLEMELNIFKKFLKDNNLDANVKEIYIGGGSPTILKEKEFDHLIVTLSEFVNIQKLNRFCIEIDPRTVTKEKLEYYYTKGVTTVSLGIQDFNPIVQTAINRIQSYKMIEDLMKTIKKLFTSINFDLIVGLPHQTPETITETINQFISLSPDRISMDFYSKGDLKYYAHTKLIDNIAIGTYDKHILFYMIVKQLESNGYLRTATGHFAKSTDAVGKSLKKQVSNFTQFGVIANRYSSIIGFGRSSSGNFGGHTGWKVMYQNYYEQNLYDNALKCGKFPIYRMHDSSNDEEACDYIIKTLRTHFVINKRYIEKEYKLNFNEYFFKELDILQEFKKDKLCKITKNKIILTDTGKHFSEIVASIFDRYSKTERYKNIII